MDFNALAAECAPWVAPQTMAAIVKTESQFHPLVIGINGGARLTRQPASKDEAVVTAKWLINNGYNIDLGLGQVNSNNLLKIGLSVEDAFDPCRNLTAAATILTWSYQSALRKTQNEQSALHAAISAYNTGSFSRGFSNGYVQKVINNVSYSEASPLSTAMPPLPIPLASGHKPATKQRARAAKKTTQTQTLSATPESDRQDVMVYR